MLFKLSFWDELIIDASTFDHFILLLTLTHNPVNNQLSSRVCKLNSKNSFSLFFSSLIVQSRCLFMWYQKVTWEWLVQQCEISQLLRPSVITSNRSGKYNKHLAKLLVQCREVCLCHYDLQITFYCLKHILPSLYASVNNIFIEKILISLVFVS